MEKVIFNHSLKDIPIPAFYQFLVLLIDRTTDFIRRVRWKTFHYTKKTNKDVGQNNYGFRSRKCPPANRYLIGFEDDLVDIIRKVKFKNSNCHFQKLLMNEINNIRNSDAVYVKADKSRNLYKMSPSNYNNLKLHAITKDYKTDRDKTLLKMNTDTLNHANKLNITERIGGVKQKNSYILIKDHKIDYENKKAVRLINPTKTELGKVSNIILQDVVNCLKNKLGLNLWISTKEAIDWFSSIKNMDKATFIQFDIVEFYPSIKERILMDSLEFAKQHTNLTSSDVEIIMSCRKNILMHNNEIWVKSGVANGFDVPMGAFDSAQISDIIGIYILDKLSSIADKAEMGLYRDDGLMVVNNSNGPLTERLKKRMIAAFKQMGFKVEITSNVKEVNYLDVTFNLNNGVYHPYHKDNQTPSYVHRRSNHPNHVLKQIPKSICKRINTNSSNREIFNNHKMRYEDALRASGYNDKLEFEEKTENTTNNTNNKKRKNRGRKIVWYNPPYCKLSNINISREFVKLVRRHFPSGHPLHPILNKNSLKVSYSCTSNMDNIISAHNLKVLKTHSLTADEDAKDCNCRIKTECPLDGVCNVRDVVYQAEIYPENKPQEAKYYIGLASGKWKHRYTNHKSAMTNRPDNFEKYDHKTALSDKFWEMDTGKKTQSSNGQL